MLKCVIKIKFLLFFINNFGILIIVCSEVYLLIFRKKMEVLICES